MFFYVFKQILYARYILELLSSPIAPHNYKQ